MWKRVHGAIVMPNIGPDSRIKQIFHHQCTSYHRLICVQQFQMCSPPKRSSDSIPRVRIVSIISSPRLTQRISCVLYNLSIFSKKRVPHFECEGLRHPNHVPWFSACKILTMQSGRVHCFEHQQIFSSVNCDNCTLSLFCYCDGHIKAVHEKYWYKGQHWFN
jgi:hypothetical protein